MTRFWLVRPSSELRGGFEVRPLAWDHLLLDWREERARMLAPTWATAVALVPSGNVKRAVAEEGAWFGPAPERAEVAA